MQAKGHSISIQFQMEIQINQDVDNLTSLIMIDRSKIIQIKSFAFCHSPRSWRMCSVASSWVT